MSGTDTPQPVFLDAALAVPATNPLVADITGKFAPFWLAAVAYRFTMTDAAGVTIEGPTDGISNVVSVAGDVLTAGALSLTTGQITFPAVPVPSTNPNTLDRYDERDFTPILVSSGGSSGQTYTHQLGRSGNTEKCSVLDPCRSRDGQERSVPARFTLRINAVYRRKWPDAHAVRRHHLLGWVRGKLCDGSCRSCLRARRPWGSTDHRGSVQSRCRACFRYLLIGSHFQVHVRTWLCHERVAAWACEHSKGEPGQHRTAGTIQKASPCMENSAVSRRTSGGGGSRQDVKDCATMPFQCCSPRTAALADSRARVARADAGRCDVAGVLTMITGRVTDA